VRRTTLTLVVALVALMVAGGVAFAETINGDDGRTSYAAMAATTTLPEAKGWTSSLRVRATITLAPQATVLETW
jgi:hypothetical protein